KNGSGVLAYISNNSFIDGITHRQMRKHLLETFDKIYILDLHGNSRIKETSPDGSVDQNVFDIMQGVSINIFVKTGNKSKDSLGKVFHSDLYGKRDIKYKTLNGLNFYNEKWLELPLDNNYLFFVPRDFELEKKYNDGFKVTDLFEIYGSGFKTERDSVTIHFTKNDIEKVINDFKSLTEDEIRIKYNLKKDARDWGVLRAKNDLINNNDSNLYKKVVYRHFDVRHTYFTGTSKGFIGTPGTKVNSLLLKENIALLFKRQCKQTFSYVFLVDKPCESCTFESAFANNISFPLYIYPDKKNKDLFADGQERTPNLKAEIVNQIAENLGLTFTNEKENTQNTFAPIDILDYIYAVLHSPTYREKYKEFLKIDFPRVPYPKDQDTFWQLVKLGGEIRQIHLLESPTVEQYITQYPIDGDNVVSRKITKRSPGYVADNETHGKVYINDEQYFDNIPLTAWEFYIG